MTDSIEAFLNSDVGKKAVEAATRAPIDEWKPDAWDSIRDEQKDRLRKEQITSLRAFLSSLAEQGALREACAGPEYMHHSHWRASTRNAHIKITTDAFPAFILRRE